MTDGELQALIDCAARRGDVIVVGDQFNQRGALMWIPGRSNHGHGRKARVRLPGGRVISCDPDRLRLPEGPP